MLKNDEIIKEIIALFAESDKEPYEVGNGICTNIAIAFNAEKLESKKKYIAELLQETGIGNHPLISLELLTKTSNGETWNNLDDLKDFQALELLLACSHACGFIVNNGSVKQLNINTMGDMNSIVISGIGREMLGDEWLDTFKKVALKNMYFPVDQAKISETLESETPKIETGPKKL